MLSSQQMLMAQILVKWGGTGSRGRVPLYENSHTFIYFQSVLNNHVMRIERPIGMKQMALESKISWAFIIADGLIFQIYVDLWYNVKQIILLWSIFFLKSSK